MTALTIRDEVHLAWRGILARAGCRPDMVDALVLELDQACDGHGARLPRGVRPQDPNAVALAPLPAPGDATAGAQAVRAALRPYSGPDDRADRTPATRLPEPPEEP